MGIIAFFHIDVTFACFFFAHLSFIMQPLCDFPSSKTNCVVLVFNGKKCSAAQEVMLIVFLAETYLLNKRNMWVVRISYQVQTDIANIFGWTFKEISYFGTLSSLS